MDFATFLQEDTRRENKSLQNRGAFSPDRLLELLAVFNHTTRLKIVKPQQNWLYLILIQTTEVLDGVETIIRCSVYRILYSIYFLFIYSNVSKQ